MFTPLLPGPSPCRLLLVCPMIGGWVALGTNQRCAQNVIVAMGNPSIWLTDASHSTDTTLQFETLRAGVVLLTFVIYS